jgi:hypothetical protein
MPALVLDAGALIAADRDDRAVLAKLRIAERHGLDLRSNGGVIAEVWRDGARQARLARLLKAVEVVAIDEELGQQAGGLLGKSASEDPVDATVVAIAASGDQILTGDVRDIGRLVVASRQAVHVVRC